MTYVNKSMQPALRQEIRKILKRLKQEESWLQVVWGWNCIIENLVWHELGGKKRFGGFPRNLYKIIREEMQTT